MRSGRLGLAALLLPLLARLASAAVIPMTMHTLVDDKAVHGVAFRYLAPQGWKTTAKLIWTDNIMSPTTLFLGEASADDRFGFTMISSLDFPFFGQGPSQYGSPGFQTGKQPPRVLSDFLLEHVKTLFPKAAIEVTGRDDKPLTGAALPPKRNFGMASGIEFAFTDDKGRPCTGMAAARCNGLGLGGGQGTALGAHWNGDWQVENLVVLVGPKGEEKKTMRFFSLSAPTITATRRFAAIRYAYVDMVIAQTNAATNEQGRQNIANLKAQFERGQMQFHATQEQNAKGIAAWRAQEAAQDRSLQGFKDYLGNVERYQGANGEEIKATQTVGGAWQGPNGAVLLSDDPHYDPNGLRPEAGGWHRLQKAP